MILMDVFEPEQVKDLISKSVPVSQVALNSQGYADYQWIDCNGRTIQVERKQIDEILGGLDHVEEQLRREVVMTDETILVYEGTVEPYKDIKPQVRSWKPVNNGKIMVPHHTYNMSYVGLQAWFYQLSQAGITPFHTFDFWGTARAIVAWYNSCQQKEHTTLKRYIKPKIYLEDYNPHILNLMSLKEAGIGEEKAKALIDRFGTFWYTINQPVEMLAETLVGNKRLGEVTARKLLKSIGRI